MDQVNVTLVLLVLGLAVWLFANQKFPVDQVALMVLGTLIVLGLVTPSQAISGLSNPATVTVACMFVLSAALQRTGAIRSAGRLIIRHGKKPLILLALTMFIVGAASAFINNTGVVAVMLPLVLAASAKNKLAPSRLLMPMSFAAQAGGVCTLIGTSTNLLVSAIAQESPHLAAPFSMFELGKMGLMMFGACLLYFLSFGRWLLPDRPAAEVTKSYELGEYLTELRVMKDSPLIGKTVRASQLAGEHGVKLVKLLRNGNPVARQTMRRLKQGDILLIEGKIKDLLNLKDAEKLEHAPAQQLQSIALKAEHLSLVQAVVPPNSHLIGRTLIDVYFHRRHRAIVLAVQRRGRRLYEKMDGIRFAAGDSILLQGPTEDIEQLRADENFIMLGEVAEGLLRKTKAPLALAIVAGVVVLATFQVLPVVAGALIGCILMVLTRCLSLDDAYEAIDWKVIFLLAGVLPLGIAMETSGAAELIAQKSLEFGGQFGPTTALAAMFLLTAVLTETMSNSAAAVLLAPIAISTAVKLGVDPKPFLVAVTFAASTSFATPVGYQTNVMIYNPGGYKYTDFLKVGIPLNVIFWGIAVYFIPRFWPFHVHGYGP